MGISVKITCKITLFLLIATVAGCASQPLVNTDSAPGLFSGLFHGFFILPAFIASLFVDDISIYAFPNSGGWYDFGYIIGVSAFAYAGDKSTESAT